MSPFKSKAQPRAAFGGYLGAEMKSKAEEWAHETPGGIRNLPSRKGSSHTRYKLQLDRKATMPKKGTGR